MSQPQITPTVGRKVWFFDGNSKGIEPQDATIIKVHAAPEHATPETYVNLLVIDGNTGVSRLETSIKAEPSECGWRHFEWMPYQQGQAAKTAAVEAAAPSRLPYPAFAPAERY